MGENIASTAPKVPDALYTRLHDFRFRLFHLPQIQKSAPARSSIQPKFETSETDAVPERPDRRGWTGLDAV